MARACQAGVMRLREQNARSKRAARNIVAKRTRNPHARTNPIIGWQVASGNEVCCRSTPLGEKQRGLGLKGRNDKAVESHISRKTSEMWGTHGSIGWEKSRGDSLRGLCGFAELSSRLPRRAVGARAERSAVFFF